MNPPRNAGSQCHSSVGVPGSMTVGRSPSLISSAVKHLLLLNRLMYITYHLHEEYPTFRRRPQHPALLLLPHAWMLSLTITTSLNRDWGLIRAWNCATGES